MATLVSIASGKGGVGKSVAAANLAIAVARAGRRVVLADLDVGGANLHVMLGRCTPSHTVADFLQRRVPRLSDVLQPVEFCPGLQLLPGAADTLDGANPHHASKHRLVRELRRLDADVVIADIGAGAGYTALDFFLAADVRIAVTTPDPTAVLDVYAFVKLAALRAVQTALGRSDVAAADLRRQSFASLEHVLSFAAAGDTERARRVEAVLRDFRPLLLVNRTTRTARVNVAQVKRILKQYVGSELGLLGEIPDDDAVAGGVRGYMPVVEFAPDSPAARAFGEAAVRLLATLDATTRPAIAEATSLAG